MKSFRIISVILVLAFALVTCSKDSPTDSADTTAPGAIVNLTILGTVDTTAILAWTAPGDDGYEGTATLYDIRYATDSLVLKNWTNARSYPDPPEPMSAGSSQQHEIGGLSLDSSYYFGIKSADDVGNISDLSNMAAQEVPEAPRVYITSHANGDEVADLVDIVAVAADNKGITKVEFFVDTLSIGIDITPPYTAQWDAHTLSDNSSHVMYAVATDTDNNSSGSSTVTVIIDTLLSTPSELLLFPPSSITQSSFDLTWVASADNDFHSYRVWWTYTGDEWPNNWQSHILGSISDTSYTVAGLYDNTRYTYRFVIRDVFGHERHYSSYEITTEDIPPPIVSSSVWRTSLGATLRWLPLDLRDFRAYKVWKSTDTELDVSDELIYDSYNIRDSIFHDSIASDTNSIFYFVQALDTSGNQSVTPPMELPLGSNHCLRFDGNQFVSIPATDSLLGNPTVSIEMFINLEGNSLHGFAFSQGSGQLELEINGSVITPHIASTCWNRTATNILSGDWHHVAVVTSRQQTFTNLYVDGILVDSMICSGYNFYSGPLRIGMRGGGYGYTGLIDELRIWSYVRTLEDINNSIGIVLTGTEEGLVGYWKMDEGVGMQITGIGGVGVFGADGQAPVWAPSTSPLSY